MLYIHSFLIREESAKCVAFSGTHSIHMSSPRRESREKRSEEKKEKKYLGGSWHHHRRRVLTISAHFSFSLSAEAWNDDAVPLDSLAPTVSFFLIAYNIFFTLSSCPSIFVSFFFAVRWARPALSSETRWRYFVKYYDGKRIFHFQFSLCAREFSHFN